MQSAVRALVVRLGPAQIIDTKEQAAGMAFLSNRKARAWDAYEALHAEILRDLSDDFDSVFGKRFALAYEQAMEELVARQKNRGMTGDDMETDPSAGGLLGLALAGCGNPRSHRRKHRRLRRPHWN